jgi:hypothetical protein
MTRVNKARIRCKFSFGHVFALAKTKKGLVSLKVGAPVMFFSVAV